MSVGRVVYRCKPYPYSRYCTLPGYRPFGPNALWEEVWTETSRCAPPPAPDSAPARPNATHGGEAPTRRPSTAPRAAAPPSAADSVVDVRTDIQDAEQVAGAGAAAVYAAGGGASSRARTLLWASVGTLAVGVVATGLLCRARKGASESEDAVEWDDEGVVEEGRREGGPAAADETTSSDGRRDSGDASPRDARPRPDPWALSTTHAAVRSTRAHAGRTGRAPSRADAAPAASATRPAPPSETIPPSRTYHARSRPEGECAAQQQGWEASAPRRSAASDAAGPSEAGATRSAQSIWRGTATEEQSWDVLLRTHQAAQSTMSALASQSKDNTWAIQAPPGKLGITIMQAPQGCVVAHVKSGSRLEGIVFEGDLIMSFNDRDVLGCRVKDLIALFADSVDVEKKITVMGLKH